MIVSEKELCAVPLTTICAMPEGSANVIVSGLPPVSVSRTAPPAEYTVTVSGAITNKNPSRSFALLSGAGTASGTLTFSKAAPLTVTVYSAGGSVLLTETGGSPLTMTFGLPSGIAQIVVSGTAQSSFSLTISYPAP